MGAERLGREIKEKETEEENEHPRERNEEGKREIRRIREKVGGRKRRGESRYLLKSMLTIYSQAWSPDRNAHTSFLNQRERLVQEADENK